jgi:uncharacterized protein (TIGR02996 family)
MIADDEWALWRAAVERPADPAVIEAYADWLVAHDRRRGELLRKSLHAKLSDAEKWGRQRAWEAAVGVPGGFEDASIDPVPTTLRLYADRIGEADAILDRAAFLTVVLRFLDSTDAEAVFANAVIAKVRRLWFWAYTSRYEPDFGGGYHREDDYYGDKVLEALCASPQVAGLESLTLFDHAIGPRCATLLAGARFARLHDLSILREKIGDEGAVALAGSAVLASLRSLSLDGCGISSAGARALAGSVNLGQLEQLELRHNPIGAEGAAALRSSTHLTSLRSLEVDTY